MKLRPDEFCERLYASKSDSQVDGTEGQEIDHLLQRDIFKIEWGWSCHKMDGKGPSFDNFAAELNWKKAGRRASP